MKGKLWCLAQSGVPVETIPAPLIHQAALGCPELDYGFGVCEPAPDEPRIVQRLIEAYHLAMQDDPFRRERQADVWSEINDHHHCEIITLLTNRDVAGVSAYLRNAHAQGITQGITQGTDATQSLRTDSMAQRNVACTYLDALVSPAPSDAPSIKPGKSATTKLCSGATRTTPKLGCKVVNVEFYKA